MIPFNPGNVLKFNRFQVWQRHKQHGQNRHAFGLKCPTARLVPFQLFIEDGASVVTWKIVSPTDSGTFTTMTAGDLTIENKDGGGSWVIWFGTSDLTTPIACGFWEVWVTVDGIDYYSETIHAWDDEEGELTWRMVFSGGGQDKENVLFQTAYSHYFYPTKWVWDRPEFDRNLNITVDGNENETIRFSRTVTRYKIEVADIPDYLIPFFSKCGDYDIQQIEDTANGYRVTMSNTVFEARPQGIGLNIGVFTFDAETEVFNGCQANYTLA